MMKILISNINFSGVVYQLGSLTGGPLLYKADNAIWNIESIEGKQE
jgi:hypothetical protein